MFVNTKEFNHPYYAVIFSSLRAESENGYGKMAHIDAQIKGKSEWYKSYNVRICKVESDYSFEN